MPDSSSLLPITHKPLLIAHWREQGSVVFIDTTVDYGPNGPLSRCLRTGVEWDLSTCDLIEHHPCAEAQKEHQQRTRFERLQLRVDLLTNDKKGVWLRRWLVGVDAEDLPDGRRVYYDTNGDERLIVKPPFTFRMEELWSVEEEIPF
jgi:hypothetical protein